MSKREDPNYNVTFKNTKIDHLHIGDKVYQITTDAKTLGFKLFTLDYFKHHESKEEDFELWRSGWSFEIESIKEKKEFRRSRIIDEIEAKLESNRNLLIVGESGTSKSTVLMEVICDYLDRGYLALYKDGTEIENSDLLIRFIEDLLKKNNKLIVAIDNAHKVATAPIFYVVEQLSRYELKQHIRFILTARLPDYDHFIEHEMNKVESQTYRRAIGKFNNNSDFRHTLPRFSKDDIKGFIKQYNYSKNLSYKYLVREEQDTEQLELSDRELEIISEIIFEDTEGVAILVKNSVLGQSLLEDAKEKWRNYLQSYPERIKTHIAVYLLETGDFPVTTELLDIIRLLDSAIALDGATIHDNSGIWKTIHHRYNSELLSFMYGQDGKGRLRFPLNKAFFEAAVYLVLDAKDEKSTVAMINALHKCLENDSLRSANVEKVIDRFFKNVPSFLSKKTVFNLYMMSANYYYFRPSYGYADSEDMEKKIYEKANLRFDEALKIDNKSDKAWTKKADTLWRLEKYQDALACYNKALEINPQNYEALAGKGEDLYDLERYEDAFKCFELMLKLSPDEMAKWDLEGADDLHFNVKAGDCLDRLEKYQEAVNFYSRATDIYPDKALFWIQKGNALLNMRRFEEAIASFSKITETPPHLLCTKIAETPQNVFITDYFHACGGKGDALRFLKRYTEASECFSKGWTALSSYYIEQGLDTTYPDSIEDFNNGLKCAEKAIMHVQSNVEAWCNKSHALIRLKRYEEAIQCLNKTLGLDKNHSPSWYFKGIALFEMENYDEAIKCFEKVIELTSNENDRASAWMQKGACFHRKEIFSEAIRCFDEAILLQPDSISAWYNRACAKARQGDTEGAMTDLIKANGLDITYSTIEEAKQDKDFISLRNDERFKKLILS